MLDDSDVFSIIVDPKTPSRVYVSACSGIYKSDNGADLFHRVQGLPHSAIRTRVLKQDPVRPSIVYAGTTGGMWKTVDGGAKWTLVTSPDVVVNDILIDPRNPDRVLIATDRGGVLASNDGFVKYQASNRGFSHRMVGAVIPDLKVQDRLYVGIVNDKVHGGMFTTDDVGKTWLQVSQGLGDRDILSLDQAENGVLLCRHEPRHLLPEFARRALAAGGDDRGPVPEWQPKPEPPRQACGDFQVVQVKDCGRSQDAGQRGEERPQSRCRFRSRLRRVCARSRSPTRPGTPPRTKACSSASTAARSGMGLPVDGESDFVAANDYPDGTLTLATIKRAFLSRDGGRNWTEVSIPEVRNWYSTTSP